MARRLIDHNAFTGISTWHHYDHSTGKTHIESTQDVSRIIERNKRLQNDSSYADRGRKNDMMHLATIPNNVIVKLKNEHGVDCFNKDDLPKLEKLLQSNEFKYLRAY
jgi:hypothetical protein